MFNGLPLPDFDEISPILLGTQLPHAQIFICEQSAVRFGQDKKNPALTRSVVTIRHDGPRSIAAPATGLDIKINRKRGFELTRERMLWVAGTPETLWAMPSYEAINKDRLLKCQGYLTPKGKQEFGAWIKQRYARHGME